MGRKHAHWGYAHSCHQRFGDQILEHAAYICKYYNQQKYKSQIKSYTFLKE